MSCAKLVFLSETAYSRTRERPDAYFHALCVNLTQSASHGDDSEGIADWGLNIFCERFSVFWWGVYGCAWLLKQAVTRAMRLVRRVSSLISKGSMDRRDLRVASWVSIGS